MLFREEVYGRGGGGRAIKTHLHIEAQLDGYNGEGTIRYGLCSENCGCTLPPTGEAIRDGINI